MSEALLRFKRWWNSQAQRWKYAAMAELDPRNPDKRRLVCAWGLLITGGLFLLIGAAFLMSGH